MSREFGEHGSGFFHWKLQNCLEDLKYEADHDFHKKFIPLFESLYEIAYAISSVEAGDSSLDRSISTTLQELPNIKKFIKEMENTLQPYQRVSEDAVRAYIKEQEKKNE